MIKDLAGFLPEGDGGRITVVMTRTGDKYTTVFVSAEFEKHGVPGLKITGTLEESEKEYLLVKDRAISVINNLSNILAVEKAAAEAGKKKTVKSKAAPAPATAEAPEEGEESPEVPAKAPKAEKKVEEKKPEGPKPTPDFKKAVDKILGTVANRRNDRDVVAFSLKNLSKRATNDDDRAYMAIRVKEDLNLVYNDQFEISDASPAGQEAPVQKAPVADVIPEPVPEADNAMMF